MYEERNYCDDDDDNGNDDANEQPEEPFWSPRFTLLQCHTGSLKTSVIHRVPPYRDICGRQVTEYNTAVSLTSIKTFVMISEKDVDLMVFSGTRM